MELTGKVIHVGETETFASGFQKRLLVIEKEDGKYTNNYGVQALKDNVDRFDGISEGQEVCIEVFDNSVAKCREYQGKWYSDLPTLMKIEVVGAGEHAPAEDPGNEDIPW